MIKTFNEIPYSDPDLIAPGRGAEQWHGGIEVNVPVEGTHTIPLDVYHRFVWTRLEGPTQGSYNWTYFDNLVNAAIARKQKMSFGIMTDYPDGDTNLGLAKYRDGSLSSYPQYVHDHMQQEAVKDWKPDTTWVPNYNSQFYIDRLLALHQALNQHIYDKGWEKVIQFIDIRGYGCWGEWNSSGIVDHVSEYPNGTFPTVSSLKKIVDAHRDGFPNFPLVSMIAGFDGEWLGNVYNPKEIAYYLLTQKNNWGLFGWRRDQWGATDQYLRDYLENNNRSFNGLVFKNAIMERWKYAPITGEPAPFSNDMAILEANVRLYHATSFGNGNYGNTPNATVKSRVRAASKACGYRLKMISADVSSAGNVVTTKINWQNIGLAPTYENWDTVIEFVNSAGSVVHSAVSEFKPKLFLPSTTPTLITDVTTLPASASGPITARVMIKDPTGYRFPMPLAIEGKRSDGSYELGTVTLSTTPPPPPPPPNKPPVVSVGVDLSITAPVSNVLLSGSAIDTDGFIANLKWTQRSGPNTAVIGNSTIGETGVTNLVPGTYKFRLTATDNSGAIAFDELDVVVHPEVVVPPPPPNKPPVVSVGTDVEITLPENSLELVGDISDIDGKIINLVWTVEKGSGVITNPNLIWTTIKNLTAGEHIVRLTVTDDSGATAYDEKIIVVHPEVVVPPPPPVVAEVEKVEASVQVITRTIYKIIFKDGTSQEIVDEKIS